MNNPTAGAHRERAEAGGSGERMEESRSARRRTRVGGWLVALVALLVTVNGLGWFFVGPSLSTFEQDTGIALEGFRRQYPTVTHLVALQARNTGVLLMGLGLLALGAFLQSRRGEGWARRSLWIFALTLAGVGLSEWASGAPLGAAYLGLGGLASLGQLLAARG